MTITSITTELKAIPLKKPFITALRRVDCVQSILVTLTTQSGITGFGEAPPTVAITGESSESIIHTIETIIAPKILHTNFSHITELLHVIHNSCSKNSSAKAAVDMAVYNLFAQESHQPLFSFLGGNYTPISTYITISLNAVEMMVKDAVEAYGNGFTLLKIKVGSNDGNDLQRILHVKQAIPDAKLIIDANQAWSYEKSVSIINALKDIEIVAIEQPVIANDIDSLQAITQYSHIPIIADEAVFSIDDAREIINRKAADIINIKLMKCGGISKALEIIELCRHHNISCMLGSMLEGTTSIEAAMHLAMANQDVIKLIDLDSPILYETMPKYCVIGYKESRLLITALESTYGGK